MEVPSSMDGGNTHQAEQSVKYNIASHVTGYNVEMLNSLKKEPLSSMFVYVRQNLWSNAHLVYQIIKLLTAHSTWRFSKMELSLVSHCQH
jgi:hypothetical protein